MEHAALAAPFRRVIGFLCEQARHRVLATSIQNAESDGLIDKIIHGTWLADIDGKQGRGLIRSAILALPIATFLRMTLASHYISRVYWNHWNKEDRLALLDLAELAIQPLNTKIDKPKLKRLIENELAKLNLETSE